LLLNAIALEAVISLYVSPVKLMSHVPLFTANCNLKFLSFCLSLLAVTLMSERSLKASQSVVRVAVVFCAARTGPTSVVSVFSKNLYVD
jgi:hypothetical protein